MEEDEEDADRADKAYHEEEKAHEARGETAVIGQFVADHLPRNVPSDEQAGEQST